MKIFLHKLQFSCAFNSVDGHATRNALQKNALEVGIALLTAASLSADNGDSVY